MRPNDDDIPMDGSHHHTPRVIANVVMRSIPVFLVVMAHECVAVVVMRHYWYVSSSQNSYLHRNSLKPIRHPDDCRRNSSTMGNPWWSCLDRPFPLRHRGRTQRDHRHWKWLRQDLHPDWTCHVLAALARTDSEQSVHGGGDESFPKKLASFHCDYRERVGQSDFGS